MFDAQSDFLMIYCRVERRLADPTCKAYERDARACLEHLRDEGITALGDIRTPDLRRFLAEEATHRPSPSSRARTLAALRCFFRFCVENECIERDPASDRSQTAQPHHVSAARRAVLDVLPSSPVSYCPSGLKGVVCPSGLMGVVISSPPCGWTVTAFALGPAYMKTL
jgi:integrase/recombinase XerD